MTANHVLMSRSRMPGILTDDEKRIGLDYICTKFRKEQEC